MIHITFLIFLILILLVYSVVNCINIIENNDDDDGNDEDAICNACVICPVNSMTTKPDPVNCANYYMCVSGVPIRQFCPTGFTYSVELERCVEAHLNDCGDRPYKPNNVSTASAAANISSFVYNNANDA